MKERDMQVLFGKYLRANPPPVTEVHELKMTSGKSIRWDRVAQHQLQALLDSSGEVGHYWKIPDMTSMGGFASPKPYDSQFVKNAKAYVVVWFYKPRQPKVFHKINVVDYMDLMAPAPRKSYREEDIAEISEKLYITKTVEK